MNKMEAAVSATSGIAANLLYLGRTAHNRFKLPFNPHGDSTCNIKKQSDLAKFLIEAVLFVIDEGPMLNKLCYESLDRSMRDLVPAEDKKKKNWRQDCPCQCRFLTAAASDGKDK